MAFVAGLTINTAVKLLLNVRQKTSRVSIRSSFQARGIYKRATGRQALIRKSLHAAHPREHDSLLASRSLV